MSILLGILVWVGWIAVACVGLFLALMLLAFGGDEPRANKALQKAIPLAMLLVFAALFGGVVLLIWGGWWQVILAYLLALSPPLAIGTITSMILRRTKTAPPAPPTA